MNLEAIAMPVEDARREFRAYRDAIRSRRYEQRDDLERTFRNEDEIILRTYRQLARGHRIINLPETLAAGGVDELGRPKLAVARADQRSVRLASEYMGSRNDRHWVICGEDATVERKYHEQHARSYCHILPVEMVPPLANRQAVAVVPLVPAPLRPDANLQNYHILWEAEWRRVAPRDPALLKHMGGDAYAVLAVWDLTEVERLALGLRLSQMRK